MRQWNKMPSFLQTKSVRYYYNLLKRKLAYRFIKRVFDIFSSFILLLLLFLPMLIISLSIIVSSKGGAFFLQERIGRYGKPFKIIKFRTMKIHQEVSSHITVNNDPRVTKIGKFLRKTHLDEIPQLFNVFVGQMSFVGTRPEVYYYLDNYKEEWLATLLMRPGITSTASCKYKDEAKSISTNDADSLYIKNVLPIKMSFNLEDLKSSNILREIKILFLTFLLIFK